MIFSEDITERKNIERALRASEERLMADLHAMNKLHEVSTLFARETNREKILEEIISAAIAISGADFANIQLLDSETSGLRIVAQRGFPQWWLDYWNQASKRRGTCGTALELGKRIIVENVERSPIFDGTDLQMQLKAGVRAVQSTPLVSRSGKPLGMFSTHYRAPTRPDERSLQLLDLLGRQAADIIDQIHARSAQRASEERFRVMANGIPLMIWVVDAEGRLEFANKAFTDFFGGTVEHIESRGWNSLVHPEDVAQYFGEFTACLRDRRPFQAAARLKRHDGEWRWVESSGRPRFSSRGTFLGIAGSSPDITERRRAETALRESGERFRALVNATSYELIRMGPEWTQMLPLDDSSLVAGTQNRGRTWLREDIHPADQPRIMETIHEAIRNKSLFELEYRILRPDGTQGWTALRAVPQLDAGGEIAEWFGAASDITARKQAEEKLRLEQQREKEARLKDEFLALLGHELRNPLAAISTGMEVLSGVVTAEQRAEIEEMMRRQVELMRRLLDDLLDLGRITHGHIELVKDCIDLAEFLQRAAAAHQASVSNRGQELLLRLPSESVPFMADRIRLEQIASNLLSNASKYTGKGGRIELSGKREGTEVVLRCQDNGQGIPPEMHEKIFEPFTRGMTATDTHGEASLGIGLSLVKQLTELHGGTISVESGGPGMGSEFTVRLPLVTPSSDQAAAVKSKPAPPSWSPHSIAIVEDNPTVAQVTRIALEQAGHRVRIFRDGAAALAGIPELKPDAVLLDIGLPDMDGYQLAAKLKEQRNMRNTMFIALSGFQRREQARRAVEGFDLYFTKPVDVRALLAALGTTAPAGAADDGVNHRESGPVRVLLVEDHSKLAAAMAALFRAQRHDVRTALTGREALETALDFRPQLILCDLKLPDMDGLEVIRRLRSCPQTQRAHIVILTARSESEVRELNRNAKDLGVDEFLAKPIGAKRIRTLVSNMKLQALAPPTPRQ